MGNAAVDARVSRFQLLRSRVQGVCMNAEIDIYIYISMYIYMYVHIYIHIHIYVGINIYTPISPCQLLRLRVQGVCMNVGDDIWICMYMYIYTYILKYVYVYISIYVYCDVSFFRRMCKVCV